MRNRKDKIFALIAAGCLCLSGLTGCGEIKMSPDNISSKSDDGLMGSVKEETDTSDESEADAFAVILLAIFVPVVAVFKIVFI